MTEPNLADVIVWHRAQERLATLIEVHEHLQKNYHDVLTTKAFLTNEKRAARRQIAKLQRHVVGSEEG